MSITRAKQSSLRTGVTKYDSFLGGLPYTPIIGTATDGGTGSTVSVAFTANNTAGLTYTALSTPGSLTGTSTTSPITVSGLSSGTAYTFQVNATNSAGTSAYSAASNSVTPVTPTSFESIATATGTGSSATITFSSIPSTYSSLQFRIQSKYNQTSSATAMDLKIYFNGVNTGTSYAYHQLKGNGSTVTAAGSASQTEIGIDSPIPSSDTSYANITGVGIIDIHDYASTSKNKTLRALTGYDVNGAGQIILSSGLRASTDAITSVSFLLGNAGYRWTTDTVISLYGIKGA